MKSGWAGGIVAACLLVSASHASGDDVSFFIDGEAVVLEHPALSKDGHLWVPLSEFGLRLGVEAASIPEERSVGLRWATGSRFFPLDHFPVYEGLVYARPDELVTLVGATMRSSGGRIDIEAEPTLLIGFDASSDGLTLRFNAFTPCEPVQAAGKSLALRFYHCSLATPARQRRFSEGRITLVDVSALTPRTVDVLVNVSGRVLPQTKRLEAPGFYSVSLGFAQPPSAETEEEVLPHVTYREIETNLGKGPVKIKYLYVDQWRDDYRLVPAVPEAGIGRLASLKEMARAHGALAGINANFFDTATNKPVGLLIIDGQVLSSNYGRRAALGIDLFGRLEFLNPTVSLFLRLEDDRRIPVDDVNRPIRPNELVAYSPGYVGTISRGASQPFRVVKVRSDRVVAASDTPYVVADSTATLLVASGTARSRLSAVRIGDAVSLDYALDEGDPLITDAVSAGPLLVRAGEDVLDTTGESFRPDSSLVTGLAARSLLATDWYGGLILLTVLYGPGSVGADFADLLSILHALPVSIRDAIAFDGGHSSSLVFKDGASYREISSGGQVAVGLLLVSTKR